MGSTLFPQHVIARKRDGHELSREEIAAFVRGATDGSWADYQLSAMLMAVVWRGMTARETADYTEAMMRSGVVADLSNVRAPKSDKHSTGGVGDKVSLHLAPMVAACGVAVPMISGRGLGHTGGTLDKLESIPGFRVNLSLAEFRACALTTMIADPAHLSAFDRAFAEFFSLPVPGRPRPTIMAPREPMTPDPSAAPAPADSPPDGDGGQQ